MSIQGLIEEWERQAKLLDRESESIWKKLKNGELPQDDQTIYSVYQRSSEAYTLRACASQLRGLRKEQLK